MWSKSIEFGPRTLATLPDLQPGPDGAARQVDFYDSSEPGLYLRVSSTGRRTWFLMARVARNGENKPARFKIGVAPRHGNANGMSLAEARRAAYDLKGDISRGIDPKQQKFEQTQQQLEASRNTFAAVVDRFLTEYPKSRPPERPMRVNTIRQYRDFLKGPDFSILNRKPVKSITKADIQRVLDSMVARGCGSRANRALASVGKMFRWLAGRGELDVIPTLYMPQPAREAPRSRHLFGNKEHQRPSELALAWRAFEPCGQVNGACLKILMLTGARLQEAARMRWSELVDLDGPNPRWIIPRERTKNWREHVVPIGPMALAVLNAVPRFDECDFVFTLRGRKPVNGWTMLAKKINAAVAELKNSDPERYAGQLDTPWTRHDLRRTFKTGLAELGINREVRDALLNHVAGRGIDNVYNHSALAGPKRAAIEAWERHISECLDPAPKSNIVPFQVAKAL